MTDVTLAISENQNMVHFLTFVFAGAVCQAAEPSKPNFELAIAGLHHWTHDGVETSRHVNLNVENKHRRHPRPTFWVVLTNRSDKPIKIWTHFTESAVHFQYRVQDGTVFSITANPTYQGLRPPIYKMELDPGEPFVFPIEFCDRYWRNIPRGVGELRALFSIKESASRQPEFWSGTVESSFVECSISGSAADVGGKEFSIQKAN